MGDMVTPLEEIKGVNKRKPIGAFKSGLAAVLLWLVNLLVTLFGWPFLLYGKLKYRKTEHFK